MPRSFEEDTLVIASHNKGKIKEIEALLEPFGINVKGGPDFNLEEPEENGDTFIANAKIKSEYFAKHTKLPSLSDDSGLVVPALDGAPGIYSARWAGESKNFQHAMEKVEAAIKETGVAAEGQPAHFVCALSLTWPDGHTETVEGYVHGKLTFPAKGEKGFGYDPIFIPQHHAVTFAQMEPEEKHNMSHRADAFNKLIAACFKQRVNAA